MVCSPHNYIVQQVATGIDYASVRNMVSGELQKQAAVYQMTSQLQRPYLGSTVEDKIGMKMYGTTPDRSSQQQYGLPQQVRSDLFLGEGIQSVTPPQAREKELPRKEQPFIPYQNLLLTYLAVLKTDKSDDTTSETQRRRDELAKKIEDELSLINRDRTTRQQDETMKQPQMMRLYN